MSYKRTDRLNSLLKEVISDVIRHRVRNPKVSKLLTVTRVDITSDLQFAKVYVSVIGDEKSKKESLEALQSGAGFIGVQASRNVVMRHFPSLTFKLDDSTDDFIRIDQLLQKVNEERQDREEGSEL